MFKRFVMKNKNIAEQEIAAAIVWPTLHEDTQGK